MTHDRGLTDTLSVSILKQCVGDTLSRDSQLYHMDYVLLCIYSGNQKSVIILKI